MQLPTLSIQRPVLATVMNLVILLVGIICYERLAVRLIPNVDEPIVSVFTGYPGANAQVIDVTTISKTGKVIFGTTIDLVNVDSGETVTYRIVGEDEADVKQNLISVGSPIARALIGKEEGDTVIVRAPGGDIEYEIDQVRHI